MSHCEGALSPRTPPSLSHPLGAAITFFWVELLQTTNACMPAWCKTSCLPSPPVAPRLQQMERARAILQRTSGGLDKICIVQDYVGFSMRNSPSMKTSLRTLNTLQNHYPETLGVAYFVSPPMVFRGFFKVNFTGRSLIPTIIQ